MSDPKIQEAADLLGVKRQRVQTLVEQGRLSSYKKKNRVYIKKSSLDSYIADKEGTKTVQKSGKKYEPDEITDTTPGERSSLAKVELALKAEKYKGEKIKNEKSVKNLIDVHEAVDNTFDYINQIKDHIQSQHDRIGLKLHGAQSQHEIEQILKDDNTRALTRIAENFNDLDDDAVKKKLFQLIVRE